MYRAIPDELKELKQWCCFKLKQREEKMTKIPVSAYDGSPAKSNDENTWSDFDTAIEAIEKFNLDGLGFFFKAPYFGIDIDDVEEEIKRFKNEDHDNNIVSEFVEMMCSYSEISVSGTGLHIIAKGDLPEGARRRGNVEMYDSGRFFVMTGSQIGIYTRVEEDEFNKINYLHNKYLHKTEIPESRNITSESYGTSLTEDELISIALKSKIGNRFQLFLNGGWEKLYDSQSEADMAFTNDLSFWSNCDYAMMDNIFRRSSLMRGKWDREQNSSTYGDETLRKAINDCKNTFNPTKKTDLNIIGLELTDKGSVIPNARNAEKILTNSPFEGVLAFDIFKGTEVVKGNLPWRNRERPNADFELWLGSDDKRLLHYFGVNYDFNSAKIIENAYLDVVRRNAFHPVKDYLEGQSWDGVPRVETLFIDYLGAEDTPYIRAVTRKWLAAAVTRIYEPGCKFDYMPVLVGPQGVGKSTLIAKLAREWFSDSLKNLDGKEASEHLQSSWIFEFGELAAMKKGEVEEIKAFITKQTDSYRVAYERVVSDFPRKCVFIGTTNRNDFLRDQTGNRRFWAVATNPMNRKCEINDLTDKVIGQIWAEVMNLYKQGEKLYLDSELEEEAREIQESHMESDPRVGLIEEYLDRLLPLDWNTKEIYERVNFLSGDSGYKIGELKRERVCAAEIWSECLGNDHKNLKPFEASAIYDILRKLKGWEERKPSRTNFKHYGKQTTFIRCF